MFPGNPARDGRGAPPDQNGAFVENFAPDFLQAVKGERLMSAQETFLYPLQKAVEMLFGKAFESSAHLLSQE